MEMMNNRFLALLLSGFFVTLVSCTDGEAKIAAPVGDYKTLEKLADAFRNVSGQMDNNPRQLPPAERKRFVEFVFRDAGFNYSATLAAMASAELDPSNQTQRDLAELLLFPHQGGSLTSELADIYSKREQENVLVIEEAFK